MATNDIKEKVKSLYEIMKDENLEELKVNSKDYKLSIKRKSVLQTKTSDITKQQTQDVAKEIVQDRPKQNEQIVSSETVKSPITGIFYKSPSPSSDDFVKEGDVVDAGTTLCIIEAMKVMNEIKASFKMKIIKILSVNGKPVSTGQDLFEIEKV